LKTINKVGLTLGKYAPLHRGHQSVIEKAIEQMDKVKVLIYDSPEITSIPLPVRAGWIRNLYPQVEVVEVWDGPAEVGNTPEIKTKHEKYLLNNLKISGITAFYSSEFYGEHVSRALSAKNIQIDPERKKFPVSGLKIREDPYKFRKFIHPIVYRDLITNVVFLGAPSTGKTTIASVMAKEYCTGWMPEYGREYWEKHQVNRRLSHKQLAEIAEIHLQIEDKKLLSSNRYLFTDTNALITYIFSMDYYGAADEKLKEIVNKTTSRYDLCFLCDTDIPYDNTWDRSGEVKREVFQKRIIAELNLRKIPFYILRGEIKTRVEYIKKILSKFKKFGNIMEGII
jgi:HTH-type transcriptional regulator, transcriptional repressor of NAD biosynthesis genes